VSLSVGHPLLDAIIKLTAQRDQETLADALVDAILTLTNTDSASVYALGGVSKVTIQSLWRQKTDTR